MSLPVYSRADVSRAVALVVALSLTAVSTSVDAREFHAAGPQSKDHPTVQALRYMDGIVAGKRGDRHQIPVFHPRQPGEENETVGQRSAGAIDLDRKPFEAAMSGTAAGAQRDGAAARLIERIRKLE